MSKDTKVAATPVLQQPQHNRAVDGVELTMGLEKYPEIAGLQRVAGNRAAAGQTALLSRQLLHPSNRVNVVQRVWPFSETKTMPIDEAAGTASSLNFDMDLADSMWKVENTPAAGAKALEALLAIETKLKALKTTVSKGKYKGADAARKEEVMGQIDAAIAKVARLIANTRESIAALKLQAATAATGGYVSGGGGPSAPRGPDALLAKIKSGAETGMNTFSAASAVETGTRSGQLLGAQNKKAMMDNATGGELETNKVEATGRGGVQGFMDSLSQWVTSIKESIFNISWVKKIIDFLEPLKNYTFLVSVLYDAYKLYSTYDRYSALKAGNDEVTTSGATDALAKSIGYGFAKVKRALYSNIAKFALSLSKSVARLITLLTGGATALVTESIALAADLATAVMTFGRKAKGLYKAIRGTRGKARGENAGKIYDSAMQGDKRALKLMIALKPFGLLATLKNKTYINNIPETPDAMLTWMHANARDRDAVVKTLATALKSQ